MIDCSETRCFGFSYKEVETMIEMWNKKAEPVYEGAIVQVDLGDYRYDFAEILNDIRPCLHISPRAISIYAEAGYIYPRRGIDVIVIDGIQEELDSE